MFPAIEVLMVNSRSFTNGKIMEFNIQDDYHGEANRAQSANNFPCVRVLDFAASPGLRGVLERCTISCEQPASRVGIRSSAQ